MIKIMSPFSLRDREPASRWTRSDVVPLIPA
jgi:hypothetical protein